MTSRVALFFFFMGLLLGTSPMVSAESFDFFYFILMWPGAYCAQSACCVPKTGLPASDFFIRGLQTYNATTGNAVTKCSSASFYSDEITSLKDGLYAYWSNIGCPSNDGKNSWRSTWKTYGVCTTMSEVDYFKAALELRTKICLLSILAKKGIYPDYNMYKVDAIKSAIREELGVTPAIRCSKGPYGKFQLYEVHICVDKDGSTLIKCPVYPKFTCSDEVLFHPYRSWMLMNNNKAAGVAAESYITMVGGGDA